MAGSQSGIGRRRESASASGFWTPGRIALVADLLVFLVATATLSFLVGAVASPATGVESAQVDSGSSAPDLGSANGEVVDGPGGAEPATESRGAAADADAPVATARDDEPALTGPPDADGYPARMEAACAGTLPDADPQVPDVYVEVDTTGNVTLADETAERIRESFADAPVSNPTGDGGMRIHLVRSDTGLPERGPVDNERAPGEYDDVWDYRAKHFDNADAGYYYLLLTNDASYGGDAGYAGAATNGTAVAQSYDSPSIMTSLIMHELGHTFGLGSGHPGVDSREYDASEYRSVMNYNVLYDVEGYSNGTDAVGHDEWAFVAEDRYRPSVDVPPNGTCPGSA